MKWRTWFAAGVFVVILLAAILILRRGEPPQTGRVDPPNAQEPAAVSAPPPPLSRADLIDAAARAADAYSRGVATPLDDVDLVGRRFTVRLPFGCGGPKGDESKAPMRWNYDVEQETLRASVRPEVWTQAGFIRSLAEGVEFEAAEGFWIVRPWLRAGDCPRQPSMRPDQPTSQNPAPKNRRESESSHPVASPVHARLALAELFAPGSPRAGRRNGRAYDVVTKLAPGDIDLQRGLRLLIEGRLAALPAGQPIACRAVSTEEPPSCLISVRFDRIAITDASGERVLAEWAD